MPPQRTARFPFASCAGIEASAMTRSSMIAGSTRTPASVVPEEVAQFDRLAADWWDPDGASAMLHKLNPVRLKYVRDMVDQHWQADECSRTPLEGKTALDVG